MRAALLPLLAGLLLATPARSEGVRIGSFVVAGGQQQVAHGLGEVPAAVLFWTEGLETDAPGGPWTDLQSSIALCDDTGCRGFSGLGRQLENAVSSFSASHALAVHYLRYASSGGARLLGWDAEHFELSWSSTVPAFRVHFLALGGPRVRAKWVEWRLPPVTGEHEIAVGFRPSLLITLFGGREKTAIPQVSDWMNVSLSAATGPGERSWVSGFTTERPSSVSRWSWQRKGRIALEGIPGEPPLVEVALAGFTDEGFRVQVPSTTGEAGVLLTLAVAGLDAEVGSVVAPTTEGAATLGVEGLSFAPGVLLLKSILGPSSDQMQWGSRWGLGAADAQHQLWSAYREWIRPAERMLSVGGTDALHAPLREVWQAPLGRTRLAGFTDDGFQLDFSDHDGVPVEMMWLALAPRPPPRLHFTLQPESVAALQPMPPIEVSALELTEPPSHVELRLEGCGGEAALAGTARQPVIDGLARFEDLSVTATGSDCRLAATPSPDGWVLSEAFTVGAVVAPTPFAVGCGCGTAPAATSLALLGALGLLRRRRARHPGR